MHGSVLSRNLHNTRTKTGSSIHALFESRLLAVSVSSDMLRPTVGCKKGFVWKFSVTFKVRIGMDGYVTRLVNVCIT